jgi:vancomycin permeability regulator SanA
VRSAILVTQRFHLPRALYLCNAMGVQSIGVPADQRQYRQRSLFYWNMRETVATLVAMLQVHVTKPLPILGNPKPIFPEAQ